MVRLRVVAPYLHVTKPLIRGQQVGYVAQHKGLGLYKARFRRAVDAAAWLATEMGISVDSLKRKAVRSKKMGPVSMRRPWSMHTGVIWKHQRWFARCRGRVIGHYATEVGAARALAKKLRCKPKSLRKAKLTKRWATKLFPAAFQAFRHYVPGDVESLESLVVKFKASMKKEFLHNRVSEVY